MMEPRNWRCEGRWVTFGEWCSVLACRLAGRKEVRHG